MLEKVEGTRIGDQEIAKWVAAITETVGALLKVLDWG